MNGPLLSLLIALVTLGRGDHQFLCFLSVLSGSLTAPCLSIAPDNSMDKTSSLSDLGDTLKMNLETSTSDILLFKQLKYYKT